MSKLPKFVLIAIGWIAVSLGFIGVFLPVLPTTPFLLVAAWAFAHSSPRFRSWLVNHPIFGRMIRDWELHGAIPLKAKLIAVAMMATSMIVLVMWSGLPAYVLGLVAVCLFGAASFILTRPTAKKGPAS